MEPPKRVVPKDSHYFLLEPIQGGIWGLCGVIWGVFGGVWNVSGE